MEDKESKDIVNKDDTTIEIEPYNEMEELFPCKKDKKHFNIDSFEY